MENSILNQKLFKMAYTDTVTDLGNETYFKENGSIYLLNTKKNKYILTLDIFRFKALNNIYGFEFCNKILKLLAIKIKTILPEDNIMCRISNDIFATVFSYDYDIRILLDKLIKEASKLNIENKDISINLSIGAYKIKEKDRDINNVLSKAYMARAETKGKYNINYYIYDEILENRIIQEQQIESTMEMALENKEFKVIYQSKIDTKTEKIAGAEALVRWHRGNKIIPPNKFIPLFEKNKFINKLDIYIYEEVCKDISDWKKKYKFVPITSINVSKTHFENENFIDEYVQIADNYGLNTNELDLEITESATVDESIDSLKILKDIKSKGFTVSMDDFGTGYSSLSMLQSMPIDIIKIDKVFVDKADLNSDQNIINYIMLIAKHLGVKTIVEGVETKEEVEFVKKLGCDLIQGYYYSKPMEKKEFEEYFSKN